MPKFMTYQRPTPVNKNAWAGRPGTNPYQPARKGSRQLPEGAKPVQPLLLLGAPKSS